MKSITPTTLLSRVIPNYRSVSPHEGLWRRWLQRRARAQAEERLRARLIERLHDKPR